MDDILSKIAERYKDLEGMDRVVQSHISANWRFPQAGTVIIAYTMNAILTDPNPQERLAEYLSYELTPEKAEELYANAVRAHIAFLPPDKQPVIDVARLKKLWEDGREDIQALLYQVTLATDDEPVHTELTAEQAVRIREHIATRPFSPEALLFLMQTIIRAFFLPEVIPLVTQYRESYRDWNGEANPDGDAVYEKIGNLVQPFVEAQIAERPDLDARVIQKAIQFFVTAGRL